MEINMDTVNPAVADGTKVEEPVAVKPAPVKKIRTQKAVQKPSNKLPLILSKPVTSAGANNTGLDLSIHKNYQAVRVYDETGKTIKATIWLSKTGEPEPVKKAGKKVQPPETITTVGIHTRNFIFALVDAVLSGKGAGPDGSALYVRDNWSKVSTHWGANFARCLLEAVPAGRSGAKLYRSPIGVWATIAGEKARLIDDSIKTAGASKPVARGSKATSSEPENFSF